MANISAKFRLIDEMSAKLDNIAQSGRNALSQWETAGAAIDTAFDGATATTATTATSIDTATDAVEQFSAATKQAHSTNDQFTDTAEELGDALDDVAQSTDRAGESVEDYGEETENARKKSEEFGKKSGEAISGLEQMLVSAGIMQAINAIGNAFVSCVEDAIQFESAITGVYKTVDGTPEQLAQISDEVKELSIRIPSTTTEIAAVAETAGQLSIATDDVMSFTEVMINLGEATNLSADEAASSLAKFMNITGTSADEYENLGSTIVALGNNFATTEADIVAMSTRMASAGTLAGLTESDILALAASISSVGIEADAGGSSMSTLLSKMQLAVETGNDQLEQFASVAGYTADEFAQKWGEDAAGALYAFIDGLNDTERNGASATAILDEMGITEIRLSNAIKALANNSDNLGTALGFAAGAWEENNALATEANTRYGTLESRMSMAKNAATNLSTAIGEDLTPIVGGFVDAGTGVINWLTDVVEKYPAVSGVITGVAVALGVVAVAIAGYTVATKVATAVTTAFGVASMAALWPLYLVAAAIGAVVAVAVIASNSISDADKEFQSLTATSKEQYIELENLNAEYEEACNTYGETSEEALRLKYQMDDLEESFEANKQTLEEFQEEIQNACDSASQMREDYIALTEENRATELGVFSLIQKYEDLATKTELTAGEQKQLEAVTRGLADAFPDLADKIDIASLSAEKYVELLKRTAQDEADRRQREADQEAYINALQQRTILSEKLAKAEANLEASRASDDNAWFLSDAWFYKVTGESWLGSWATQTDEYKDALAAVNVEIEENKELIADLEKKYGDLATATEDAKDKTISYADGVNEALSSVESEIEELCTAYDEAYQAARESIDGQIGLFDDIVVEVEKSIEEMQGAWESQINYLTSYTENLKKAIDFGLDRSLVEQLSDSSEESAAYLDTIISKVEDLGGTTTEAKKFVDDFNAKFQEVETAKNEFAGQVAEIETNFSDKMTEIENRLDKAIDNMNMSDDAKASAKATMDAYVAEIKSGGDSAVATAESAARRVRTALANGEVYTETAASGSSKSNGSTGGAGRLTYQSAYADGTDYASKGYALVGEEGPEIVEFAGGEKVYTADETEKIFSSLDKLETAGQEISYNTYEGDQSYNYAGDTAYNTYDGNESIAQILGAERTGKADMLTTEAVAEKEFYAAPQNDVEKPTTQTPTGGQRTIRLEIDGSGAIEIDGSVDEETVVAILQQHLKPILTGIVQQEIYEEGELAYDF